MHFTYIAAIFLMHFKYIAAIFLMHFRLHDIRQQGFVQSCLKSWLQHSSIAINTKFAYLSVMNVAEALSCSLISKSYLAFHHLQCWQNAGWDIGNRADFKQSYKFPFSMASESLVNQTTRSSQRLFLVEERAWQHWGVGAVYFCHVMIHVIYSDHTLFWKLSCALLRLGSLSYLEWQCSK